MKWVDLAAYKPASGGPLDAVQISNGLSAIQNALNDVTIAGADLASAATINITSPFHGITGVATIDNIADAQSPTAGEIVQLWIKGGPLTIRNNGGGAGNIRTLSGLDRAAAANEIIVFVYDGTLWREGPGVAKGSVTLIFDFTVTGAPVATLDSNTILGGNIPATYKHLKLITTGQWSGTTTEYILMKLNNDGGANYDWILESVSNLGAAGSGVEADTSIRSGFLGANGHNMEWTFPNYAGAVLNKTVLGLGGAHGDIGTIGRLSTLEMFAGWRNNVALTRIALAANSGNFAIGTRLTLLGIS